jgi:hypothetical protein
MLRSVLCCALVVLFGAPCGAQPASKPETLIRLTVSPSRPPSPALRYLLLPELKEMNPGNPIHGYLRCFMEQQKFFFDKEAFERREKLLAVPLRELPAQELRDYGGFALAQADWAARLDNPDWQILLKLKSDGIYLPIPDVQQLRALANALKVRSRAEIAMGRFDDAIRTSKTMLAMARHLGEHPTYVGNLVGIAVAFVAIGPLEELIQQPGSPNLYWALTNLPSPLVSLEKGTQGERIWVDPEFRELNERAPMSGDQIARFVDHVDGIISLDETAKVKRRARAWLDEKCKDESIVSAARGRLVESGLTESLVKRFPPEQVMLLDERRSYEVRRDDLMKIIGLPMWEFEAIANKAQPTKEQPLFDLEPAIRKVRQAQTRLDQRIALLRVVESLRVYAAINSGKLPADLHEIFPPAPADPLTGQPFQYQLTGATAHVRGTPPADRQSEPAFSVHYELAILK